MFISITFLSLLFLGKEKEKNPRHVGFKDKNSATAVFSIASTTDTVTANG